MTRKEVFVAFNGKEFDNESECLSYEDWLIQSKYGGLKTWRYDCPTERFFPTSPFNWNKIVLCSIETKEEVKLAQELANEDNLSAPYDVGKWIYDDDQERWLPLEHFDYLYKAVKFLEEQ